MALDRERIAHYKVVRLAGAGGMGEVYVAEDEHLRRRVAIKVIGSGGVSDGDARKRFLREAHAAAALTHPNVAHIYDVGSDAGLDYIVMEYIEGETLQARLARGSMPIEEVVSVAQQVVDALAAAHQNGVVHRDIKPANVMLTTRGEVKVLDFGLAKTDASHVNDDTGTDLGTAPGTVPGTISYMSPEQALGEPVTSSSDVFSVGVVLYEMLTGRRPFAGRTSADTVHRLVTRDPEPLARFNYEVPVELERIVLKCLEKKTSTRYRSARELLVDLQALARDRSSGRWPSWARPMRVRFARRAVIALAVIALAIAGVWLVRSVWRHVFPPDVRSIAVLPFNAGGGDLEYISNGIADSLINALGTGRRVRVMARSTVFRYNRSTLTPQQIGRELDVDAVVVADMQRRGDTLSVDAEMVSVDDGARLWGERYEHKASNILGIESDLARGVGRALRIDQSTPRVAVGPHRDEAHSLYLRAEDAMNRRTPASIASAVADLRRAIATDENYAPPYAALADSMTLAVRYAEVPTAQLCGAARQAAQRALQLDPSLAEAHVAMGSVNDTCDWNWAAAEKEYRKAIDIRYGDVLAHQWLALLLTRLGRRDEALREIGVARMQDPLSATVSLAAAYIDYHGRSYDTAAAYCAKAIELEPSSSFAHLQMALIKMQQRHCSDARSDVAAGGASAAAVAALGVLDACEGKRTGAEAALAQLARLNVDYGTAVVAAALQRNDVALQALGRAFERHDIYAGYANVDPLLDSLRGNPRFTALMRRAALER